MVRAAIADVSILSCWSCISGGGLGGGCKGAVRQNVLHHATTIHSNEQETYQSPWMEKIKTKPKRKGGQLAPKILLNNSH
jgi:hypothetical protein